MSRNPSHKSEVNETPLSVTPNWTKNEKYCVTRLPGRPSHLDNVVQFRNFPKEEKETDLSSYLWDYIRRVVLCADFDS